MNKRSLFVLLTLIVTASMLLSACGAPATEPPVATEAPTEAPTPEPTPEMPAIGSEEHPIKVLFVPSVDAQVIVSGGEVMAAALNEATGLTFEVSVPTSYAATIEEMCASPADTMGFIPAVGYVLANDLCGVDVAFKALRGSSKTSVYWAAIIVARDSEFQTFEDLNGAKFGYGSALSGSGNLAPQGMFEQYGIAPSESVETGGHGQSVTAVYNGEVDFASVFYNAPVNPEGNDAWTEADWFAGSVTPEMWDVPADVLDSCAPDATAEALICTGWEIVDARALVRTEAPDVAQKVRILTLSPEIPNDTLSFGPEFPADVRAQIEQALLDFSTTQEWADTMGSRDFYNWVGITTATDADYDLIRAAIKRLGLTLDDV
ncbi:MAG: phosphate/phosphite/phosphonate ABC transporter substrate-binding protein [Anaerolineales bacterium]|nr:phosphate/phosphite/phosphonate ABC transporter substrate-binding protein [Anaerolineales bacterium]